MTVWIGEIQWMLKHGLPPSRNPILKKLDQIECRDALLTPSPLAPSATSPEDKGEGGGEGAFVEAEWPKVDVIIGNPPFLGDKKMIGELGEDYAGTLRAEYAGRVPGGADLVTYWFEKARAQIEAGQASRAGLVATNSIRGGASRKVLERILATVIPGRAQREPGIQNAANNLDSRVRGNDGAEGMPCRIYNAWSDEPWINDGAAVRVSIVCFGAPDTHLPIVLDGKSVSCIHANLSADQIGEISLDLTTARGLSENADGSYFGLCLAGAFAVEGETARQWLRAPGNPDGTQNRAVLRPLYNGLDVTRRPRDRWVIDFGVSMSEQQAAFYEEPFRHITEHVKPIRLANNRKSRVSYWWRHGETRPGLRRALTGIDRYIATSETSKHRYFVWLPVGVAPEHKLVVIPRADDVVFGMLSSRPHIVWALAMGSTLEDRPVYTTHACFQTFPFPDSLTPNLKPEHYTNPHTAEIAAAAQRLNELRENWLNPPEWVERVPEVVPGYPERVIPKPEYAKAIKERTLTNLYNKRAKHEVQWLEDAHRTLDAAVARAYGWDDYTPAMPDEEILRRLLALNLQRAGKA